MENTGLLRTLPFFMGTWRVGDSPAPPHGITLQAGTPRPARKHFVGNDQEAATWRANPPGPRGDEKTCAERGVPSCGLAIFFQSAMFDYRRDIGTIVWCY
jgi:hypothetical protein